MASASTVVAETRPGAKATARFVRMSASKVRVVLDLIRNKPVAEAIEILSFSERLAAKEVLKCLRSAVANAEHNEDIPEAELFISVCFADEGPSLRRFRPRARGRAGRIRKQTCHITVEVARLTDDELDEMRKRSELKSATKSKSASSRPSGGDRARRVAKSKAAAAAVAGETTEADDAEVDAEIFDAEVEETADIATDGGDADQTEESTTDIGDEVEADGADVDGADVDGADVDGADVDGADVDDADVDADVDDADVDDAVAVDEADGEDAETDDTEGEEK